MEETNGKHYPTIQLGLSPVGLSIELKLNGSMIEYEVELSSVCLVEAKQASLYTLSCPVAAVFLVQ